MAKAGSGTRGGMTRDATQALRLLALEMAANAGARQRRRVDAAAPLLSILFGRFLMQEAQGAGWPDRDRLVIAPALRPLACALTRLLGHGETSAENGKAGEDTPGGEAREHARAGDTVCSPQPEELDLPFAQPGHSLAGGVGLALAARLLRERFGPEIFDHATCIIIDDSEVEPGIAQETIAIAPFLRPHRLFVFHLTPQDAQGNHVGRQHCPNHLARFAAAGWHVQQANVEDPASIVAALEQGADQGVATWEERRPVYVAVQYRADMPAPEPEALRGELGWRDMPAGEVPDAVRDTWRLAGLRRGKARKDWQARVEQLEPTDRTALTRQLERPFPERFRTHMRELRQRVANEGGTWDMKAFLRRLLEESRDVLSGLVMLSALPEGMLPASTGPRNEGRREEGTTDSSPSDPITTDIGLRPAAVAALLAGMSAHGGLRPVGLALRRQLEPMLPMLAEAARATLPLTLLVLDDAPCRSLHGVLPAKAHGCTPADAVELVECWQLCMQQEPGPAVILTPVDERPLVRASAEKLNLSALGAYELFSAANPAHAAIYAAGWQLGAVLKAARMLEEEGLPVRLVSVPAPHRLFVQDAEHRKRIIGADEERIVVFGGCERGIWPFLTDDVHLISPCKDETPLSEEELIEKVARAIRMVLGEAAEAARGADGQPANGAGEDNGGNGGS